MAVIGKECDENTGEALFGDIDEKDIAEITPQCHDYEEADTYAGPTDSEEE